MTPKHPFDIHRVIQLIRHAVRGFPKAAMFALAEEGFGTAFEMLVACIISIRTRDEVTMVCARRLFGLARTPDAMSRLSAGEIDKAIGASTFHEPKAGQIREISRRIMKEHDGDLPCRNDVLLSFQGVGPRAYWVEINRLLVPFGKHVCTGSLPRCSTCPVLDMCRQVGVEAHR